MTEAAFACSRCGAPAGVVRAVPAGEPTGIRGPAQLRSQPADGVVVEGFLGRTWRAAGAEAFAWVRRLLEAPDPDPRELRLVHPELAPFFCPDCGLVYCAAHWAFEVVHDGDLYDCTYGTCPEGHRHMVDD